MATKLSVINTALVALGKEPLQVFDQSARCVAALTFWDIARDEALRGHPWNFAMKRASLPRLAQAPAFGYVSAYNLPADCLRVCESSDPDYALEAGQILCNSTGNILLRYIARIEDVTKWDALFAATMASILASYLAYPITQSTSQQELQYKIFQERLREARSVDAQEQPAEEFEESSLITVRG